MSHHLICPLTPALIRLLETCVKLRTTDTNILAAYLFITPVTVRNEFQIILNTLEVHCRYSALRRAEDEGWLSPSAQEKLI